MTPFIENVYRKNFGIYSLGFDRFILLDDKDIWIMLECAELLSSKISTVVYLVPKDNSEFSPSTCTEFSLIDARNQKTATTPLLFSALTPSIRTLLENSIIRKGSVVPAEIIQYANFVYLHCLALNFTEAISKYDENSKFAKKYLDPSWYSGLSLNDTRDDLPGGIYFQIRKVLHTASSIEEAEDKIYQLWLEHSADQSWVRDLYFKILNKQHPESFSSIKTNFRKYTGYAG